VLIVGLPNQTSFSFPFPPSQNSFFRAGSNTDSDGDGLTDGYETFISGTIVNTPDSSGDGTGDGLKVELGRVPGARTPDYIWFGPTP
jgi:hypothetical protein